jgi:hypothetical protein
MITLRACRHNASWNIRSALINPLVVFCVSAAIIGISIGEKGLLFIVPLVVLAANSMAVFVFWCLRLSQAGGHRQSSGVLVVGYAAYVVGCAGLLALIALLLATLSNAPATEETPQFRPDLKFWIFWGWAMIEGIHHYIYKLKFGRRDTLQHIIEGRGWSHAGGPVGGAIGIQLRKLRRREA